MISRSLTAVAILALSIQSGAWAQQNNKSASPYHADPRSAQNGAQPFVRGLGDTGQSTIKKNIAYAGTDDPAQRLDLYVPPEAKRKKVPIILWIHGGGWQGGTRMHGPFLPLLRRGYAIASVDYRLTNEGTFPIQIHDCKAAVRWVRANAHEYNIDPQHIGVLGESAGGHLVALLGTTAGDKRLDGTEGAVKESTDVQAVCDACGPTDIVEWDPPANKILPRVQPMIEKFLGGTAQQKPALAREASPIAYASHKCPPFLIVHGDHDPTVPLSQSKRFAAALKKSGNECELLIYDGGHGGGFNHGAIMNRIIAFFNKNLRPNDSDAAKYPPL